MKDFWLIPIWSNIVPYAFSRSQHYRLEKLILQTGFQHHRFDVAQSWYILLAHNLELFLHHDAIHIISHDNQNNHLKAQEISETWLKNCPFLQQDIWE